MTMEEIIKKYQHNFSNKTEVTIWLRQYDYNKQEWDGTHSKEYFKPDFIIRVDVPPSPYTNPCEGIFKGWSEIRSSVNVRVLAKGELSITIGRYDSVYYISINGSDIEFTTKSLDSAKEQAIQTMKYRMKHYRSKIKDYNNYIKILEEDIR